MMVSESLFLSESAFICTSDFCFIFFFNVRLRTTVRFVRSEQKDIGQIFCEILNDKSMRSREVYLNVTYMVNNN